MSALCLTEEFDDMKKMTGYELHNRSSYEAEGLYFHLYRELQ